MEVKVRAALEELLELVRLEHRDGQLSSALQGRKKELETVATAIVDRIVVPSPDLREIVFQLISPERHLPGVYGGLGGWFARLSSVAKGAWCVLASLIVGLAGAIGPLVGDTFIEHLSELLRGPFPYALSVWGLAYPAALSWSEETRSSQRRIGYPHIEEHLLCIGGLTVGVWLVVMEASLVVCLASVLVWVGVAVSSITVVRPVSTQRLIDQFARDLLHSGMKALSRWDSEIARQQFELVYRLEVSGKREDELLSYLRLAVLFESEELRRRGLGLAARALRWSRGVSTADEDSVQAVKKWCQRRSLDEAKILEAAGLFIEAGHVYQQTQRPQAAKRAFQTAVLITGHKKFRQRAYLASVEVDGDIDQTFLHQLFEEIENYGLVAQELLELLSELPTNISESRIFLNELGFWAERQAAGQAVAILEFIVGKHTPTERPGIYSMLADTYYRIGHRGTARRIRAELGGKYVPSTSTIDIPEPLLVPNTLDLTAALSDRYQIRSRLGVGSMGAVYLAEDVVLARPVALKVHNPKLMTDLFVEKFRAEARVVARLDHPNIVRVFDAGQTDNWLYFVMEFVDGPDLGTLLTKNDSSHPLSERLLWAIQVAEAMAYAHSQGVIHRDLKPANVLVHPGGDARVTDFGVAKVVDTDLAPHATAFSQAGLQVGTPSFMAPEQLASGSDANVLTDVYSLGMTLYYLVTNHLPFEEDPLLRLDTVPPSVREIEPLVSTKLDRLIADALAPDPDKRLYGMKPFAERLRECPEMEDSTYVPK
ncbi:MAG: serine/threonine protein kinase [Myxococcales bacterium]|nr:serine/threonine protein kinase [Myxococcales bacterium]